MKTTATFISALLAMLISAEVQASVPGLRLQGYNEQIINPELRDYGKRWPSRWISVPGESPNAYGVYLFRKSFEIGEVPESFIINISADNRYKFFVNGIPVSKGPARCDVLNWNYETVDIAPQLRKGGNTLAAMVWNYGEGRPAAQVTFGSTGLMVQGNGEAESVATTGSSWKCIADRAFSPIKTKVFGYSAVGVQERFDASLHPWGWERPEFDDSGWSSAKEDWQAAPKGNIDYSGRHLVPSPIPPMESCEERLTLRKAEGVPVPEGFTEGKAPLTVPAGCKATLLLDNRVLTNGYPRLEFSRGKGAQIVMGYAESLYESTEKPYTKGDRNVVEGKSFVGFRDMIIPDGGESRCFETLWWRTWRYIRIDIVTAEEPLVINDIRSTYSACPYSFESSFKADEMPELEKILEIGRRTARLCANETFMDCPYYEQLQYFGDTRIQAMTNLYNSSDNLLTVNAIEQGRQSMNSEGITASRYPASIIQAIPPYSLSWIGMVYDYWMHRGGEEYLSSLLPQMRSVASWFETYVKDNGSLGRMPYWNFADWPGDSRFEYGEAPADEDGDSAYRDLIYILCLDELAAMEEAFGSAAIAGHWRSIASRMRSAMRGLYWDSTRGLFADTASHGSFSQHVNTLAVLAGIVTGNEAREVMERTLSDKSLTQVTIYFSYFLQLAMVKAGLGDRYLDSLGILRDQMAMGLTTWAEMPEPTRSDCHAWGASPNIFFYKFILGISSDAPGFRRVRIEPNLCGLREVSGGIPCPGGKIETSYVRTGKGGCKAKICLPEGREGVFVWKGKEYALKGGTQTFNLK